VAEAPLVRVQDRGALDGVAVFVLFGLFVAACGGSGMQESDIGALESEGRVVSEAPEQARPEPTTPPTARPGTAAPATDREREEYLSRLSEALLAGWERPGRGSNTPPRDASVLVQLDERGYLVRWQFRRRSTDGFFNRGLEAHLEHVAETDPMLPLPSQGSTLWGEVTGDGIVVPVSEIR
jgi:hypothetical protein